MPNNSKAGMVSLESLMNAPQLENVGVPAADALVNEMNKVDDVLPGLELEPIEDIPGVESTPKAVVPPSDILDPEEKEEDDIVDPLLEAPEVKVDNNTSTLYRNTLKSMFGEELGAISTEIDGVEQEIALDDLELDEDTFLAIFNSKVDEIKEAANKNKISAEGISEFTRKLIEVEKNGGNTAGLLEIKQAYSDPLEGLDLDIIEDQKEVIFLRAKSAGQADADIHRLIRSYESEGILEEEAVKANTTLRNAIDAKVSEELLRAEKLARDREEGFKVYKTDFKKNLSQFELNDKIKTKLSDIALKPNAEGRYDIDDRYNEHRLDPVKAARLALYLYDEEEFLKQVTKKAVVEKQLSTALKIKIIPKSSAVAEPNRSVASERSVNISQLNK